MPRKDDSLAWMLGALAVGAAGTLLYPPARKATFDVFKRGSKVTSSSWFTGGENISQDEAKRKYGFIAQKPSVLHQMASARLGYTVTPDLYAAARMVRSEGADAGELRLHVALNDLERFPYAGNLFELLTYSTDPGRRGLYGKQYSPAAPGFPKANKRRFATARDPYEGDFELAAKVFADRLVGIDKAHGATKFIDVEDMGVQEGSVSFEQKDAEWRRDGYKPFTTEEFGPNFVLYRRA